jgi:hypothetical protein
MIVIKASILCAQFAAKSSEAKFSAVQRFVKAHLLVYRMGTHESQRAPDEVAEEATEYMTAARKLVLGGHRDRRFIMNMDQTPVYFSMGPKKTLAKKGEKTVHVRTSTSDTKRATVAVTICADGTVLPSVVIFKGQPGGRIEKTEFATYPPNHQYHCQHRRRCPRDRHCHRRSRRRQLRSHRQRYRHSATAMHQPANAQAICQLQYYAF